MKQLITTFLMGWMVTSAFAEQKVGVAPPLMVSFKSGTEPLKALVYKPQGVGPFPAVIWVHAVQKPLSQDGALSRFREVAQLYVSHGYVFFVTDRRNETVVFNDGEQSETKDQEAMAVIIRSAREILERNHDDLKAATEWLKTQAFVDPKKLAMSGSMGGAVQGLYEAGRSADSEIRAFVLFAPGCRQWSKSPFLRELLPRSAREARAPLFITQAQNDYSLEAMVALSKELRDKGGLNKTMVYAPHGRSQNDANLFALTGSQTWGDDVLHFLGEAMRN